MDTKFILLLFLLKFVVGQGAFQKFVIGNVCKPGGHYVSNCCCPPDKVIYQGKVLRDLDVSIEHLCRSCPEEDDMRSHGKVVYCCSKRRTKTVYGKTSSSGKMTTTSKKVLMTTTSSKRMTTMTKMAPVVGKPLTGMTGYAFVTGIGTNDLKMAKKTSLILATSFPAKNGNQVVGNRIVLTMAFQSRKTIVAVSLNRVVLKQDGLNGLVLMKNGNVTNLGNGMNLKWIGTRVQGNICTISFSIIVNGSGSFLTIIDTKVYSMTSLKRLIGLEYSLIDLKVEFAKGVSTQPSSRESSVVSSVTSGVVEVSESFSSLVPTITSSPLISSLSVIETSLVSSVLSTQVSSILESSENVVSLTETSSSSLTTSSTSVTTEATSITTKTAYNSTQLTSSSSETTEPTTSSLTTETTSSSSLTTTSTSFTTQATSITTKTSFSTTETSSSTSETTHSTSSSLTTSETSTSSSSTTESSTTSSESSFTTAESTSSSSESTTESTTSQSTTSSTSSKSSTSSTSTKTKTTSSTRSSTTKTTTSTKSTTMTTESTTTQSTTTETTTETTTTTTLVLGNFEDCTLTSGKDCDDWAMGTETIDAQTCYNLCGSQGKQYSFAWYISDSKCYCYGTCSGLSNSVDSRYYSCPV